MSATVVNQEFIAHLFIPLEGPQAAQAYQQVRQVWAACQDTLEMTGSIPGLHRPAVLPARLGELPPGDVLAGQENRAGDRQGVIRRVHDVLNLSVAMAQPMPEGRDSSRGGQAIPVRAAHGPAQRRLGWAEFGQIWSQLSPPEAGILLGEARLFLARMPSEQDGPVEATAELGESLESLLPYRVGRPRDWWRCGITTTAGYAVWDIGLGGDTSAVREIVVVAAADQDSELSAWAWSDGTAELPPFARYLMHAAKLRYEDRLLSSWHRKRPAGDVGALVAELSVALDPEGDHPGKAGLLQSLISRLGREEYRLKNLKAELTRLASTVEIAESNLAAVPGCAPGRGGEGMFAADQALAGWLTAQVADDLNYLAVDLDQITNVRSLAAEELARSKPEPVEQPGRVAQDPACTEAPGRPGDQVPPVPADITRRVFLVHGRDSLLTERIKELLRCVKLEPLEWESLVQASGSTAPYLGQLVTRAPHLAQATLVLLSPDDIVELHPDLVQDNDEPHERGRAAQPRPNVLFELGLALTAYPDRTIVVYVGHIRPIADLAGLNVIRFDGSPVAVRKVLNRLRQAECPVDDSGSDWLSPHRFADLPAYRRGADPAKNRQPPPAAPGEEGAG